MTTLEDIKKEVRATPLIERLTQAQDRMGSMCKYGHSPKMSVPVRAEDDDVFIVTTLEDAAKQIEMLRGCLEECSTFQYQICGAAMAVAHGEPEQNVWNTINSMGPLMDKTKKSLNTK